MTEKVDINVSAKERNRLLAQKNKKYFREQNVLVLNMISSPGSGKTAILEVMGKELGDKLAVVTGDVQMQYDSERINASGAKAVQIETGGACHLNAKQVREGAETLDLSPVKYLIIENVGNLVCPSGFELGEDLKVAVLSVPEGDEKPIKYPALFLQARAVIISKIDLAPYVDFKMERAEADCRKLNSRVEIFKTSCKTGKGFDRWQEYLETLYTAKFGT